MNIPVDQRPRDHYDRLRVRDCRTGDQVGNARRVLYTFISDPVLAMGTVTADLVIHPVEGDSYFEQRTWLHGAVATVHVRPKVALS